ncbi:MAG: Peptidoglycan-associated lipoprotein [Chlamydiales bacterium]|nr:Peptidoglycan-associated lipoprotein [Chlamydiales bacterium]MCH9635665.1 Peptidoglycan-associated lipoprotein [Chlamydiales bacterium]MCH9703564.1 OmpA family protein [Chlamydiota bacterium]
MKRVGLLLLMILVSSCARSSRDMWEDTKTCGRYMGQGVCSFFGQHKEKRDYPYYSNWSHEGEFVPLDGANEVASPTMEDYIPISKESPGDPDSRIPGIGSFYSPDGHLAQLFDRVRFPFDSFTIQGESNLSTLREIVTYLNRNPQTYVFIEGHADERGAAAYNLALGSRRANAVRAFLVQNGVNPDQLFTISYGKERPLALSHDDQAHKENRRAQFKLYDR